MQAAREAAQSRIEAARQRIEGRLAEQVAAAESDARARMRKRAEIFVKSGSEMRTRLSNAMVKPEPLALVPSLTWRPGAPEQSARGLQPDVTGLAARDRQLRATQAALLAQKRAELAQRMEDGTESAVRRLAGLRGVAVSFPPSEPATGDDVTEEFRADLRAMFKF
jgi:hypothetical protein